MSTPADPNVIHLRVNGVCELREYVKTTRVGGINTVFVLTPSSPDIPSYPIDASRPLKDDTCHYESGCTGS